MNLRKRWLAILMTLCMTASLAPTGVFAAGSGTASAQASTAVNSAQTAVSAETYSDLRLSRDVSNEELIKEKQPYGNDVTGSVVATNVINELYVNFNGSIHYGWSILDDMPMQYRNGSDASKDWTSSDNFYGAMGYWRPNQRTVNYKSGSKSVGALYAKDGSTPTGSPNSIGQDITSANTHLTNQYNLAEAFSPGTGKDNYVAQLVLKSNNDVYLEIYSVEKNSSGKYDNRRVRSVKVGNDSNAGDKDHIIYNYEYDAMYDLAAGDIDGDGYDEIALYFGNKIYLYSYKNNNLNQICSYVYQDTDLPGGVTDKTAPKLKSLIVTLAFGDFNADGKDELAAAKTLPYGANNQSTAGVQVFSLGNSGLQTLNWIELKASGGSVRYANVAAGDVNGDNKVELVIAGYYSETQGSAACSRDNIYYSVIDSTSLSSAKDVKADWKSTEFKIEGLLGRVVDNKDQMIPPVSLVCAATQGTGYADQVFMAGCLYSYDANNKTLDYLTRMTMNREYKKDDGGKQNKEELFVVNAIAGNFDGNAHGQEQIICALGMKSSSNDNYWYDIAYINKMYPGESDAKDATKYWYGQEQVMNYESSYDHDSDKSRASLYLSLAAVDCDDDSTLMKYKSKNISYSKPEVYTVLQSAPYFSDLEENMGYLNQSETSYGKSATSTTTATAGGSLSAGMYLSFEQDISVFGVKIASFESEFQYTNTFSYDFDYASSKTVGITYSASAGDDYAVVYTVPYMDYNYQVWVPESTIPSSGYDAWIKDFLENSYSKDKEEKKWSDLTDAEKKTAIDETKKILKPGDKIGGYWDNCTISIPMTPKTVILTVDAYDEVAERTAGLEPIRGNILKSEAGSPETYKYYSEYGKDSFSAIGEEQMVTNAEGSYTTIDCSNEKTVEHKFRYDYEMEGRVGAGAAGVTVGVIAGMGFGAGGGYSDTDSKSYSATVDNLPKDASGYSFNWKFGTREAKLNGNDVLILEYRTSNVNSMPSPPKDLRVESVTTDSVSLEWNEVPGAVRYRIYQIDTNTGMQLLMGAVPGNATSYTDRQLSPNTSYTYSVQSVMSNNASSILTKEVTASTLTSGMSDFAIIKQPEDASTYVSGSAIFEIEAQCLGSDGRPYTLHYQWQKYNEESREWEVCDLENNGYAQYTHANVVTDDAGTKYRCLVYVNSRLYIMSSTAELSIGKAKSETALSAASGGAALADGSNVKSSYTESETVITGQKVEVPVTENIGDKTYTLYTYTSGTAGDGSVTLYNDGSGNYYIKDSAGSLSKLTLTREPESISYYEKSGSGDDVTVTERRVSYIILTKDPSYTAGSKIFYVDEYGSVCSSSTSGASIMKADEKYDASPASFYKCSVTETIDSSTVSYDKWFAVTGSGADEKQYDAELNTFDVLTGGSGDSAVSIPVSSIVQQTTEEDVTQTVEKLMDGDTVTLSASVKHDQSKMPTGYITFSMTSADGTGSQTVRAAVGADGKATAEWKPVSSGVYTITAVYEGDDCFKASTSGSITVNVITPNERKLALSGTNMTYGDDPQKLQLTMLNGNASGEVSSEAVTPKSASATYSGQAAADGVVRVSSGNILFAPDKAGTYSVTAVYSEDGSEMMVTKNITVYKRNVTIIPDDINTPLGVKAELTYKLDGVAEGDESLFDGRITLSCADNGNNADNKGQYTITATFTSTALISEKYNVAVRMGTCNVTEEAYKVTNETNDANGSVKLSYTAGNLTLDLGENDFAPKGAKVTATAQPAEGYKVKCWYKKEADGEYKPVFKIGNPAEYDTSNTLVITEDIENNYGVKAEFELAYYKLEFGAEGGEDNGIVTAKYVSSSGTAGESFSSGDKVSPIQKIQLTAALKEEKSIKEWRVYSDSANADKYETVKAENGSDNYTGSTYTVSGISADTKIIVVTEDRSSANVYIYFADTEGNDISASVNSVKFNGTAADGSGGHFVYEGKKHDNVTVTVDLPESLIVESWKETASGGGKPITEGLSNQKKTYVISDLQSDRSITVTCASPNSYTVQTSVTLMGEDPGTADVGTVTVYRPGWSQDPIASGDKVLQATVLRILAHPRQAYDVRSITVNGIPMPASVLEDSGIYGDKAYTINGVKGDISITADFVKRPVITLNAIDDDSGSALGAVKAVQNGRDIARVPDEGSLRRTGTVAFRSTGDITITADPATGYEAVGFTVQRGSAAASEEDGAENSSDSGRSYIVSAGDGGVTEDITVTAKFQKIGVYTVIHSVVDTNGNEDGGLNGKIELSASRKGYANSIVDASATFGGEYRYDVYAGSDVNLMVTPDTGYRLKYLWVDGTEMSDKVTGGTYTFKQLSGDHTVKAQFDEVGNNIYFAADAAHGNISAVSKVSDDADEKPFASGDSVFAGKLIFTATANEGYRIAGWTVNGVTQTDDNGDVIKNSKFIYDVSDSQTGADIRVIFERSSYDVSFDIGNIGGSADDAVWGTVSASGSDIENGGSVKAAAGEAFTFTVNPDSEYMIESVKIGGVEFAAAAKSLSEREVTIPDVSADTKVEIRFAEIPEYTVTVSVSGNGRVIYGTETIEVTGTKNIKVKHGGSVTLTAEADEYSALYGWTKSGTDGYVSTSGTYTFAPDGDVSITAVFGKSGAYDISYTKPDKAKDGGTIKGMTVNNTPYTGGEEGGKVEKDNVAAGSTVVFEAEPADGKCVDEWIVKKKQDSADQGGQTHMMALSAADGGVSQDDGSAVKYSISNGGKTLTIENLTESIDVGVTFMDEAEYEIKAVKDASVKVTKTDGAVSSNAPAAEGDESVSAKAPRWSSAAITVGSKYSLNAEKLKTAVGNNAEYAVTNNADGGVTVTLNNIIGAIDTTAAFTKKPENTGGGGGGGGGSVTPTPAQKYTVEFCTGWLTDPADQSVENGRKAVKPELSERGNYVLEGWYTEETLKNKYSFDEPVTGNITLFAKWRLKDGTHACAAFKDTAQHWAKDAICFGVENGLMNGVSDDTFSPDGLLSRGMLVTILWRADGASKPEPQKASRFSDVSSGAWYADAVAWANANGIVTGYSAAADGQQRFGPDDSITREQLAVIMYRYAAYKGIDTTQGGMAAREYDDFENVASYAKEAVEWAVNTQLISGVSSSRLAPQGSATRAQTAAILQRFVDKSIPAYSLLVG